MVIHEEHEAHEEGLKVKLINLRETSCSSWKKKGFISPINFNIVDPNSFYV